MSIKKIKERADSYQERLIVAGKYTETFSVDAPSEKSKAHHVYAVKSLQKTSDDSITILGQINFQNGPIKEAGVNGVMNEDLLAIVVDRLNSFQSSEFKCRENAIAITKIEEALLWLNKRTQCREARGVEGTHTV